MSCTAAIDPAIDPDAPRDRANPTPEGLPRRARRWPARASLAVTAAVGLLAAAAALAQPAAALPQGPIDWGGIRFEPQVSVQGVPLQLNGAGVRYKLMFKVYAAALYTSARSDSPDALLSARTPSRLQVVMLRDIDANELGRLFTRGIQDNASRDDFVQSIPGIARMGEIFASKKRLASGEQFSVDWLPGSGTLVRINGRPAGDPIPGEAFHASLMRIWLGRAPADALLKDALLGKAPQRFRAEGPGL